MSDVFAYTIAAFTLLAIAGMAAFVMTILRIACSLNEADETDEAGADRP